MEEIAPKTEKEAAGQHMAEAEFAEGILEEILREADEDIREATETFNEDRGLQGRWPPFDITRHQPPPELAHLCFATTTLHYKLEEEEWDEKDETQIHTWLALLDLSLTGVAHEVYSRCNDLLEEFLSTNNTTDKEGNKRPLSEILSSDLRKELLERFTYDTLEYFIYRLEHKLNTAFNEHWHEAYFLAANCMTTEMMRAMQEAGVEVIRDPNEPSDKLNRMLAKFAAQRRGLLKRDLAECLGALDFTELAKHYERLLPVWKDAKVIYRQNNGRPMWRDLIRAAHPDIEFDDDLLARLTGRLNDLSQDVQEKVSEKGGDSRPSSIALEHAARLCGAAPYQYSLRHLYNVRGKAQGGHCRAENE